MLINPAISKGIKAVASICVSCPAATITGLYEANAKPNPDKIPMTGLILNVKHKI